MGLLRENTYFGGCYYSWRVVSGKHIKDQSIFVTTLNLLREELKMANFTWKGNPVTQVGMDLKVGDKVPEFTVLANDLSLVTLTDSKGKVRLISVIPSIDTPVCDAQTRRFNKEASKLDNVQILTISADLPFALNSWCAANGIENVQTLSDHRDFYSVKLMVLLSKNSDY